MAGNHGDEYEGELSLARLVRRSRPQAGSRARHHPSDGQRPGGPGGKALLAARRRQPQPRLSRQPRRDADEPARPFPREATCSPATTSSSTSTPAARRWSIFLCALVERHDDPAQQERALALMTGLGPAYGFIADNGPAAPTSMGAARRSGAIGVSGEFGGGGTATPESMAATRHAIDRLLVAVGIVDAPVFGAPPPQDGPMRILSLARHSQAIYATRRGWFEPAALPGAMVERGDVAGWYHDLEQLEQPEEALRFAEGGVVLSRRLHTMCEAGDCLIQVAEPVA